MGSIKKVVESTIMCSLCNSPMPSPRPSRLSVPATESRSASISSLESESVLLGGPSRSSMAPLETIKEDGIKIPEAPKRTASMVNVDECPRRQSMLVAGPKKRKPSCLGALHVCKTPKCAVFKRLTKPCVAPLKLCAAPLKKCATTCNPSKKSLVPTPRLGAEWKATGTRVVTGLTQTAKLIWFLISFYILAQIVIALVSTSDYDSESFYPIRLGFRFWQTQKQEAGDWLC